MSGGGSQEGSKDRLVGSAGPRAVIVNAKCHRHMSSRQPTRARPISMPKGNLVDELANERIKLTGKSLGLLLSRLCERFYNVHRARSLTECCQQRRAANGWFRIELPVLRVGARDDWGWRLAARQRLGSVAVTQSLLVQIDGSKWEFFKGSSGVISKTCSKVIGVNGRC